MFQRNQRRYHVKKLNSYHETNPVRYIKARIRSHSKRIPHNVWNQKHRYRVRKNGLLLTVPSQINPFHAILSYFYKIRFDIILPLKLMSSNLMADIPMCCLIYTLLRWKPPSVTAR
jgi:hypothetical protein